MTPIESTSVSVSRIAAGSPGSDPDGTVVWLRGDHDIATRVHLSVTMAQAARLDDADLVVDLSGVTFMDASTIGALVVASNRLRSGARSLSVRSPSPQALRLLELCGLARLVDAESRTAPHAATALGSWVDVPVGDRGAHAGPPVASDAAPSPESARAAARSSRKAQTPVDASRSRS